MEPPWVGGTKVFSWNGLGHMTKMAAMPIYGQMFKLFFFSTRNPIILKLGLHHRELKVYKVCINDDPGLILTYFKARSKKDVH